jgi:hypothetical protein
MKHGASLIIVFVAWCKLHHCMRSLVELQRGFTCVVLCNIFGYRENSFVLFAGGLQTQFSQFYPAIQD